MRTNGQVYQLITGKFWGMNYQLVRAHSRKRAMINDYGDIMLKAKIQEMEIDFQTGSIRMVFRGKLEDDQGYSAQVYARYRNEFFLLRDKHQLRKLNMRVDIRSTDMKHAMSRKPFPLHHVMH